MPQRPETETQPWTVPAEILACPPVFRVTSAITSFPRYATRPAPSPGRERTARPSVMISTVFLPDSFERCIQQLSPSWSRIFRQ